MEDSKSDSDLAQQYAGSGIRSPVVCRASTYIFIIVNIYATVPPRDIKKAKGYD